MSQHIRPMTAADTAACAALACDSEIGRRYGFEAEKLGQRLLAALAGGSAILLVAEDTGATGASEAPEEEPPDTMLCGKGLPDRGSCPPASGSGDLPSDTMLSGADPARTGAYKADTPSEGQDGRILGFAWVEPAGAFGSAPYLKLIAVHPDARGSGTGSALVEAYEEATRTRGTMWTLLVSDFNERAQDFYRRHGYRVAGGLPGFSMEGITEILMIKPKRR